MVVMGFHHLKVLTIHGESGRDPLLQRSLWFDLLPAAAPETSDPLNFSSTREIGVGVSVCGHRG